MACDSEPNNNTNAFLMAEYESLKNEIASNHKLEKLLESSAAVAVAALFSWAFSIDPAKAVPIVWLIPLVITSLCFWRYRSYRARTLEIAQYIQLVENHFIAGSIEPRSAENDQFKVIGWENRLQLIRNIRAKQSRTEQESKLVKGMSHESSSQAYWLSLIIGCVILAVVGIKLG